MLLSFSVKNFKVFKEHAFLNLNGASSEDTTKGRATYSGKESVGFVSHVAGIFGANGSGKSSLIDAMNYSKHLITSSATSYTHDDELYFKPHIFDESSASEPSEYEFQFKLNNAIFRFGFSHNKNRIYEEWLYETPLAASKRQRRWFTREYEKETDKYHWYINPEYIHDGSRLKKGTRDNALFLSSATRDNCESLQQLFSWFKNKLHIIRADEKIGSKSTASELLSSKADEIKLLLKSSGISFDDITVTERELSREDISFKDDTPKELQNLVLDQLDGTKEFDVKFIHKNSVGKDVKIGLSDESDGTQALFCLAFPLIDVLQKSATLIVDELHNNLHPNLLRHVVSLFNQQMESEKFAQLIFSSHDTSILSPIDLSENQIWFIEKNQNCQSMTYSLSDYRGLRSANFAKMYRDGRFGAIPDIARHF